MLSQESQIDPYFIANMEIAATMDDRLLVIEAQLVTLQADRDNMLRLQREALARARNRHTQLVVEVAPTLGQVVTIPEKPVINAAA